MTEMESRTVHLSDDGCVASVHFKEVAYDDFGAAETLRPHKISRLFEAGRVMSIHRGLFDGATLITKDHGLFMLGLNYTYLPALWSVHRGHTFPFKIETQLLDIGQSSVTLQSRMVNMLDSNTLATLDFKMVYVDRRTRLSNPWPDWLERKYRPLLAERRRFQMFKDSPEVPSSAYRYEVRVCESDMDHNGHTNQASYVRFCCDATHAAVKDGSLPRLHPSVWLFPLLKLQAFHSGETRMGDMLQVLVWQREEECPDTVHYIVKQQAEGGLKEVYHARFMFGQQSHL